MSSSYGPITLTGGIVTSQDVDASAEVLVIQNASPIYDVAVSFSASKPPAVSTMSGFPWMGIIQAGAPGSFHPPRTGWLGRVWFCPINASGQSAIVGSASGYGYAYITAYLPDEVPDGAVAIPRRVDLGNQPRMINVPISSLHWLSEHFVSPAVLGNKLQLDVQPITLVSGLPVGTVVYCYWLMIWQENNSAAGSMRYRLEFQYRDGASVDVGGAFSFHKGLTTLYSTAGAGFIATPDKYDGMPLAFATDVVLMPPTAREIAIYFIQEAGVVNTVFTTTIVWNVDFNNQTPVADIGNQALYTAPVNPRF